MPFKDNPSVENKLLELGYDQIAAFDEEATRGEALAYYDTSQIEGAVVFGNKISGRVGNYFENYQVRVAVSDNEISSTCECENERKICLHAIALLYAWVNDAQDFLNIDDVLQEIKKMDKDHLLDVVANILQHEPHMAQAFLKKTDIDWDEIDPVPDPE